MDTGGIIYQKQHSDIFLLRTWFVLDFITLIPFELVALLGGSDVEEAWMKAAKTARDARPGW